QPGTFPLACNDSPDCQTGACETGIGCTYDPLPDDTPCGAGWSCKSGTCTPQTVGAGTIVISEIMANPSEVVDKKGEWFELYNTTSQSIDINGWAVGDASGNIHNIVSDSAVIIPAKGYVVLTLDKDTVDNGNINPDYSYQKTSGNPDFYLNNDWDHLTLYWVGMIIDRVDYASGFGWPVESGASMQLSSNALDDDANDDPGFWCLSSSPYGLGDLGTPGGSNKVCP
ncbi:MAG: lamin tail domain-containing protein, partial [Myxococcota bacterium]|nr:lamin tail domain-containing protein [Myxococcota bacterium]